MEDWPAVASAVEELINLGAVDAGTWAALGNARSNQDDEAGAIEAYVHAVALAPDNAMLRRNYANSLINLGRLDEAAGQLDAVEALEPDAPYLALRQAELAKTRGRAKRGRDLGAGSPAPPTGLGRGPGAAGLGERLIARDFASRRLQPGHAAKAATRPLVLTWRLPKSASAAFQTASLHCKS